MSYPGRNPRTLRRLAATRQVRDLLRSAIVSGEITDGVLPSESELMMSFSTSRQTIRDALAMLRDEGLIARYQGAGTFVVASKIRHAFTHLHGVDSAPTVNTLLDMSYEPSVPRVAAKLNMRPGDSCAVVDYVTTIHGSPYYVATLYLPASLGPVVERARGGVPDWYGLYEDAGIEIGITDFSVESTIVVDDHVAQQLAVPVGSPVMLFERRIRDTSGLVLEYGFARVRGDRIAIQTQLPRRGNRRSVH
ncbi:GntR family transcriptional regulator [Gordonia sp. i37]|uniref:GntR family transcriptional regulator n=1 Tax=Gordonia sp. i37 TaxID=1961707 RepID=UPI0009AE2288|nr:GntR family transcriptional regulator [Gordonia sp. i37]OPX14941.1 hypothetical protein B1964_12440 [Gordonia sp. i37]